MLFLCTSSYIIAWPLTVLLNFRVVCYVYKSLVEMYYTINKQLT